MRNAVIDALIRVHGKNWPWNNGFIRSLPASKSGYNQKNDLLETVRYIANPTMDKVAVELKLIFWEKMFAKKHNDRIWNEYIKLAFPYTDHYLSSEDIRTTIQNDIKDIRRNIRNRIAHHEPIFKRDLQDDYKRIHRIIKWRSLETAKWVDEIQKVHSLLKEKPFTQL